MFTAGLSIIIIVVVARFWGILGKKILVSRNLEMGKFSVEKWIKMLSVNGHIVEHNGVRGSERSAAYNQEKLT